MSRAYRWPAVALLALAAGAPVASAQTDSAEAEYPAVKIGGRLQEQLYYFDNEGLGLGPEANIFARRARITADVRLSEYVSLVVAPSFEGGRTLNGSGRVRPDSTVSLSGGRGGFRLRDAYIDVRLTPGDAPTGVTVRLGQEKRPFGRYELLSSANLPSIERGAGDGLFGVGSNNLFEGAGYLSHDVGASVLLSRELAGDREVTLRVGAYNGQGESLDDVNDAKSFGARATVQLTGKLGVGGSVFSHDAVVGSDSSFRNTGWGLDAQWQKPGDEGLFLVADYMQGEDADAAQTGMRGVSVVGAYNVRLARGGWLQAVEPFARFDYADPDVDGDDDAATLVTAGVGLYLTSRAHFRVAYERQDFEAAGPEAVSGVRSMMSVSF